MLRKLVKNSSSNAILYFARFAITFVMAPVIVRALGKYDYGIWEIVFSVVGYMVLMDIGVKSAITRYVARYYAMQDEKGLRKLFNSSLFFMGLIGAIALIIFALWAFLNPEILAEKGSDSYRYVIFLLIIGLQTSISFPGYVAESFHEGLQRHYLTNAVTLANLLVGSSVAFVLLNRGFGMLTLALINAIGISIKYIIYFGLLYRPQYGNFRFERSDISWELLKELFIFGYKNFIRAIAAMVSDCSDSIVIGAFLGPAAVPFYVIPGRLAAYTRDIVRSITKPFMPYFSDLDARRDKGKAIQVLTVASKYVVGAVVPFFGTLFFLFFSFLTRWMGAEYAEKGRWVLFLLIGGYGLSLLNPFSHDLLIGIGRHGMLAKIRVAMAVFNLILSIILVQYFNIEGVALGTLIPVILFEPVLLYFTCKYLGITVNQYFKDVFLPLIIPNGLFILLLWQLTSNFTIADYPSILGAAILAFSLYGFLFFSFSLEREEKKAILGKLRLKLPLVTS